MTDAHPERGRLLAYLDDELTAPERRRTERHVRSCTECRRRLERHRRWSEQISDAAAAVDVEPPEMELHSPAGAGGSDVSEQRATAARRDATEQTSRRTSYLRAAAVVALVAGAGLLLSDAPLRALAGDVLERFSDLFGRSAPPGEVVTPADVPSGHAAESAASAASLRPESGRLLVDIRAEGGNSPPVYVRFRASTSAVVEASGASFETSPGRLLVRTDRDDTVRIALPEAGPTVTVTRDGDTLLQVEDGEVATMLSPDTVGGGTLLYRP